MTIEKVKALNWERREGELVATTPFGTYRFFERHSLGQLIPVIAFGCCDESSWDLSRAHDLTFEVASRLAQDDFNKKVLACLSGL